MLKINKYSPNNVKRTKTKKEKYMRNSLSVLNDNFFGFSVFDNLYENINHFNISKDSKKAITEISLAGVEKEDIKINFDNEYIDVSAKCGNKTYQKSMSIPFGYDAKNAIATYKNGLLTISLNQLPELEKGQILIN